MQIPRKFLVFFNLVILFVFLNFERVELKLNNIIYDKNNINNNNYYVNNNNDENSLGKDSVDNIDVIKNEGADNNKNEHINSLDVSNKDDEHGDDEDNAQEEENLYNEEKDDNNIEEDVDNENKMYFEGNPKNEEDSLDEENSQDNIKSDQDSNDDDSYDDSSKHFSDITNVYETNTNTFVDKKKDDNEEKDNEYYLKVEEGDNITVNKKEEASGLNVNEGVGALLFENNIQKEVEEKMNKEPVFGNEEEENKLVEENKSMKEEDKGDMLSTSDGNDNNNNDDENNDNNNNDDDDDDDDDEDDEDEDDEDEDDEDEEEDEEYHVNKDNREKKNKNSENITLSGKKKTSEDSIRNELSMNDENEYIYNNIQEDGKERNDEYYREQQQNGNIMSNINNTWNSIFNLFRKNNSRYINNVDYFRKEIQNEFSFRNGLYFSPTTVGEYNKLVDTKRYAYIKLPENTLIFVITANKFFFQDVIYSNNKYVSVKRKFTFVMNSIIRNLKKKFFFRNYEYQYLFKDDSFAYDSTRRLLDMDLLGEISRVTQTIHLGDFEKRKVSMHKLYGGWFHFLGIMVVNGYNCNAYEKNTNVEKVHVIPKHMIHEFKELVNKKHDDYHSGYVVGLWRDFPRNTFLPWRFSVELFLWDLLNVLPHELPHPAKLIMTYNKNMNALYQNGKQENSEMMVVEASDMVRNNSTKNSTKNNTNNNNINNNNNNNSSSSSNDFLFVESKIVKDNNYYNMLLNVWPEQVKNIVRKHPGFDVALISEEDYLNNINSDDDYYVDNEQNNVISNYDVKKNNGHGYIFLILLNKNFFVDEFMKSSNYELAKNNYFCDKVKEIMEDLEKLLDDLKNKYCPVDDNNNNNKNDDNNNNNDDNNNNNDDNNNDDDNNNNNDDNNNFPNERPVATFYNYLNDKSNYKKLNPHVLGEIAGITKHLRCENYPNIANRCIKDISIHHKYGGWFEFGGAIHLKNMNYVVPTYEQHGDIMKESFEEVILAQANCKCKSVGLWRDIPEKDMSEYRYPLNVFVLENPKYNLLNLQDIHPYLLVDILNKGLRAMKTYASGKMYNIVTSKEISNENNNANYAYLNDYQNDSTDVPDEDNETHEEEEEKEEKEEKEDETTSQSQDVDDNGPNDPFYDGTFNVLRKENEQTTSQSQDVDDNGPNDPFYDGTFNVLRKENEQTTSQSKDVDDNGPNDPFYDGTFNVLKKENEQTTSQSKDVDDNGPNDPFYDGTFNVLKKENEQTTSQSKDVDDNGPNDPFYDGTFNVLRKENEQTTSQSKDVDDNGPNDPFYDGTFNVLNNENNENEQGANIIAQGSRGQTQEYIEVENNVEQNNENNNNNDNNNNNNNDDDDDDDDNNDIDGTNKNGNLLKGTLSDNQVTSNFREKLFIFMILCLISVCLALLVSIAIKVYASVVKKKIGDKNDVVLSFKDREDIPVVSGIPAPWLSS
ncbi:conserved Plasmodium protein, unknown function [Plasmodium sp. DRC-Itaito]|nr:conserved Plasmodium protein, unknown function [Plasmodium sp. DRC-Itaito]